MHSRQEILKTNYTNYQKASKKGRTWDDYGKPCGMFLVSMIRSVMDFLVESKNPDYGITAENRQLPLEANAAEADKVLKPSRDALCIKGVSTTRAIQTSLRSQIPVRTHFDREKQDEGRYRKVYEKVPRAPYEGLLESPDIPPECKAELMRRRSLYNPVELNRGLNESVRLLLKINREKIYCEKTSCQEDNQAPAA